MPGAGKRPPQFLELGAFAEVLCNPSKLIVALVLPTCFLLLLGGCLYLGSAIADGRIGLYVRQSTPILFWLHVGYGCFCMAIVAIVLCWALWTISPNREYDILRAAALSQRLLTAIDNFVAKPKGAAFLYVILLSSGLLVVVHAIATGQRIGGGIGSRTTTPTLFWEGITAWVLGLILIAAGFREWIRKQLSKRTTDSDGR